jgi:hypothetical protein
MDTNNWEILKCRPEEGWRSVEPIAWQSEEVLQRVEEEKNILQTMKTRIANSIGHILRKNWILKYAVEG